MKQLTAERQRPRMTRIVEGDPIHVGERELVPLVRVTKRVQRRALVGSDQLRGHGWGFVHMRPVAILERGEGEDLRLPIPNETARVLSQMLLVALAVPLIAMLSVLMAREIHRQSSASGRRD